MGGCSRARPWLRGVPPRRCARAAEEQAVRSPPVVSTCPWKGVGKMTTARTVCLLLAALGGMALATAPARAGVIVYADRAGFEAAAQGLQTITFEGLAPANSFTFF